MGNATSGMTTSQGARPSHGPPSVPGAWPRGRERLPGYRVVTKKLGNQQGSSKTAICIATGSLRYADGIACASSTILSVHGLGQNLFQLRRHLMKSTHHHLLWPRSFATWEAVTAA